MKAHISVVTLGVSDVAWARRFYAEGLGWPVLQDYEQWVSFPLGDGSSALGLFRWDSLAADASVSASEQGSAFRGVTLSQIVSSDARVDALLAEAERAGGTIVRQAERGQWGGYFGYFADPDGHLWKVATSSGGEPFVAE